MRQWLDSVLFKEDGITLPKQKQCVSSVFNQLENRDLRIFCQGVSVCVTRILLREGKTKKSRKVLVGTFLATVII